MRRENRSQELLLAQQPSARACVLRCLRRVVGVLLAGACLGAPGGALAQVPGPWLSQLSSGAGDNMIWLVTPGVQTRRVIAMQCSVAPGTGAPLSCVGTMLFSLDADWRLTFAGAQVGAQDCQVGSYYASCPVRIAAGQSQTFTLDLEPSPYLRNADPLFVTGSGNFRMQPFDVSLQVRPRAALQLGQAAAMVVPGGKDAGWTRLSVSNTGPSGMLNVTLLEKLPRYLSAWVPGSVCGFDPAVSTLKCSWSRLDPGASVSLPVQLQAATGYPSSQVHASLQASGDIGVAATVSASIVVTGASVVGTQDLDPVGDVPMFSTVDDEVSIRSGPGMARDMPPPGIPVTWTLQVPAGMQVQSVTPEQDSSQMVCSYAADKVVCSAPCFGSGQFGTGANARVILSAQQQGQQTLTLSWQSSQGSGQTTQAVRVIWDQPEASPAP